MNNHSKMNISPDMLWMVNKLRAYKTNPKLGLQYAAEVMVCMM